MSSSAKGTVEKPGKMVKQKSGLNRAILDMGFYELRRQIEYKAAATGGRVEFIGRWEPSSKTCSACGGYKKGLTLKDRMYHCDECGLEIDRDLNAAINIAAFSMDQSAKANEGNVGAEINAPAPKLKLPTPGENSLHL